MKLSSLAKITVGIATGIVFVGFLAVLLPIPLLILFTRGVIPLSEEQLRAVIQAFLDHFNVIALIISAFNLLILGLIVFYIAHAIMNSSASTPTRIALAVGFFILPFLAMPAYLLIYVLPSSPPFWALTPPVQTLSETVPIPNRPLPRTLTIIAIMVVICLLLIPITGVIIVLLSLLGPSISNIF